MQKVKCADCGFLTFRCRADGMLVEADELYRDKGLLHGRGLEKYDDTPLCFAREAKLNNEVWEKAKNLPTNVERHIEKIIEEVIKQERLCDSFTKWMQGFTPKEHREMIDRQWERKWRIIEGIIFVVLAGLFTLLGAFIATHF